MADPRLAVDHRDEARDLGRNPEQPQHLARRRNPQPRNVGRDGERVALDRLDVGRMIRPIVGKALLTGLVEFLDRLDRLDQVVAGQRLGIEHDDHTPDDGVHLGPVHPLEFLDGLFGSLADRGTIRSMDAADLDVGPAVGGHPMAALMPPSSGTHPSHPTPYDIDRMHERNRRVRAHPRAVGFAVARWITAATGRFVRSTPPSVMLSYLRFHTSASFEERIPA